MLPWLFFVLDPQSAAPSISTISLFVAGSSSRSVQQQTDITYVCIYFKIIFHMTAQSGPAILTLFCLCNDKLKFRR